MKKIALVGGYLIDGTGREPLVNSLVLVEGKKITYAGPAKQISPEYEQIDINGKTIMPGLIDTHLHFSGNLTDDDTEWVLEDSSFGISPILPAFSQLIKLPKPPARIRCSTSSGVFSTAFRRE